MPNSVVEMTPSTADSPLTVQSLVRSALAPNAEDQTSTVDLSRFGLKTSQDVIKYLNSAEGEQIIADLGEQITEKKASELEQLEVNARQVLMQRLFALFMLASIAEKGHAKATKEEIQKEIDKVLHEIDDSSPSASKKQADLERAEAQYHQSLAAVKEMQDNTQRLADAREQLKIETKDTADKYSVFDKNLNEVDALGEEISDDELNKQIADIKTEMDGLSKQIMDMAAAEGQSRKVKDGKSSELKDLMNASNGANLKLASLLDMQAVRKGEKYYADADGNTKDEKGNPIDSFTKATLLMEGDSKNPTQKVVREGNKLYLIEAGEDWNTIKDNPGMKEKASQNYDRAMTVKKLVNHNKDIETVNLSTKESALKLQEQVNEQVKNDLRDAAKHTPALNAAFANTQALAKANKPAADKEVHACCEKLSPEDVLAYADKVNPQLKGELQMQFNNTNITAMSMRGVIPFQAMQAMLRNMERFGIDATKPGVTNILNDLEQNQLTNEAKPQAAPEAKVEAKQEKKYDPSFDLNPKAQEKKVEMQPAPDIEDDGPDNDNKTVHTPLYTKPTPFS